MSQRKRRGFGPSGSSVAIKDQLGFKPKLDPELQIRNKLNYTLPPPKKLDDEEPISTEQFVDSLIDQRPIEGETTKANYPVMSSKDFLDILSNAGAVHKRMGRTMKERHMQMMEYFGKIDERAWVRDQLDLLNALEDSRLEVQLKVYASWKRMYVQKVKKAMKFVQNKYPERTDAFIDAAHKYMEDMEPKKPSEIARIIRARARELLLKGDYAGYRDFSDELRIITKAHKK